MLRTFSESLCELDDAAVPDSLKEALIDKIACEAKVAVFRMKRAPRPEDTARLQKLEREHRALELALKRERSAFRAAKTDLQGFLASFDRPTAHNA